MTCKELLLHETRLAYEGPEMSLLSSLRGVTEDLARRQPEGLWHQPIWDVIVHVAGQVA